MILYKVKSMVLDFNVPYVEAKIVLVQVKEKEPISVVTTKLC